VDRARRPRRAGCLGPCASANTLAYVVGLWATTRLGAIVAGLNGWWLKEELADGIERSDPTVILADHPRLDRLGEVAAQVPRRSLDSFLGAAEMSPRLDVATVTDEDDPAIILFTSGTTGRAKGAVLSHRNLLHFPQVNLLKGAIGALTSGQSPSTGQPVAICGGPLFHISGLINVLSSPTFGGALVLPRPGRWDPEEHLRLPEQHRVTQWSGVPTMFWRLLDHPAFERHDLTSVRSIGAGGANFSPELVRALAHALPGVTLANGYGSTETTGLGVGASGADFVAHPEVVGTAQPTVEVELRDAEGGPVRDGDLGEIHLRHASVFLGYWRDQAATAAALDDERWYRTGDFGRIVDQRLRLESRVRDLVIRGGENVYPIEVENRLVEHPDVIEAAVVGIADRLLGQKVAAVVVLRERSAVSAAELRDWAATGLAAFKVPAVVTIRDSLPTTESGKVKKHLLEVELAMEAN
jgi:acyl-CoA synthetase (AMP-forming)/AMP-acid ligase II